VAGPRHIMRFHFPHWFASPRRDLNIKPNDPHIERGPASYLYCSPDRQNHSDAAIMLHRASRPAYACRCLRGWWASVRGRLGLGWASDNRVTYQPRLALHPGRAIPVTIPSKSEHLALCFLSNRRGDGPSSNRRLSGTAASPPCCARAPPCRDQ